MGAGGAVAGVIGGGGGGGARGGAAALASDAGVLPYSWLLGTAVWLGLSSALV